jgi:hypothetical protein
VDKEKPKVTVSELYDVTLGSSAVFEAKIQNEVPEKSRSRGRNELLRPVAFRPHFSMGLALGLITNELFGLPQDRVQGRRYAGNLRRFNSMATSPNGVEWKLLGRIT